MAKSKKSASPKGEKASDAQKKSGLMDGITEYITNAISDADEAAAAERVARLRENRPEAGAEELVQILIRNKCLQTGAVGAVTSGASLVPGLGTMMALTFGVAADIGMTFKMQAELVLEVAAAYEYLLSPEEKRRVILLVTGISAGANHLLEKAGEQIAKKTSERLARKSVTRAIPVIGVAASGGSNMLTTYIIGQRADAYFSRGPEAVGDWAEDLRTVGGIDERKLIGWLAETTERSWGLLGGGVQGAAGAVIVAGKSSGEVVVISAGKVKEVMSGTGKGAVQGISSATGKMVETGKWAGVSVAATAHAASSSALATGKWAVAGLAAGAGKSVTNVTRTVSGLFQRKKNADGDDESKAE